jgi:hypothetical protein
MLRFCGAYNFSYMWIYIQNIHIYAIIRISSITHICANTHTKKWQGFLVAHIYTIPVQNSIGYQLHIYVVSQIYVVAHKEKKQWQLQLQEDEKDATTIYCAIPHNYLHVSLLHRVLSPQWSKTRTEGGKKTLAKKGPKQNPKIQKTQ